METLSPPQPSILNHPEALALLADADITASDVGGVAGRLTRFLSRYLPLFGRAEQRVNAGIFVKGLLGGLPRKTAEPIAAAQGVHRKPIQCFIGKGNWDDQTVMAALRQHVVGVMGDAGAAADGVLVLDPSAFPKKGTHSCGVARTWCGRAGKIENCQVGVFLALATARGQAPLDHRLYLSEKWAADETRRAECHVPAEVVYQERWRIGLDMIDAHRAATPHGWIAADDEFGRCAPFRDALRQRGERYIMDVPCNTLVRDLEAIPPEITTAATAKKSTKKTTKTTTKKKAGVTPWVRADEWAMRQPDGAWRAIRVRDGEKGPITVSAARVRVRAKQDGRAGDEETLVIIRRPLDDGAVEMGYHLSNAGADVTLEALVRARGRRHQIEQMFGHGKGETGMGQYEVRSWVGWHHHMTMSSLALWFLCLDRMVAGEKNTGVDRSAGASNLRVSAAKKKPHAGGDRPGDHPDAAAQRGKPNLSLAHQNQNLPTPPIHGIIGMNRLQ